MTCQSLVINGCETLVIESPKLQILEVARQGPPGPPGDAGGAFLVANRFNELTTPQARQQARENLELNVIDGGTFN